MGTKLGLEAIADSEGSVRIGWVGEAVLYAALTGGMSAGLGGRYAARLASLAAMDAKIRFFGDLRALSYYDMLARNSFVRTILANRSRFASLTILTWAEGIGPAARTLAATIGGEMNLLEDTLEFDGLLYATAPRARKILIESVSGTTDSVPKQ
jgi:hypothetical protein